MKIRTETLVLKNLLLVIISFLILLSCASKGKKQNNTINGTNLPLVTNQNQSSIQILGGKLPYIGEGEQLYILSPSKVGEGKNTVVLKPLLGESELWPKMIFEIDQGVLIVKSGTVAGLPVIIEGTNKEFYEKITAMLTRGYTSLPAGTSQKRVYILDEERTVRAVISEPTNVIYLEHVMILGNIDKKGLPLTLYKNNGEALKGYIPIKGYLVIPQKKVKDVIRVDLGNKTFLPKYKIQGGGTQSSLNKMFGVKLTYDKFSSPNILVKVFRAGEEGGSITIQEAKNAQKFYLAPHQMLVFSSPKKFDVKITAENVEEYPHQILW